MKICFIIAIIALSSLSSALSQEIVYDASRYQVIVDRSPFGEEIIQETTSAEKNVSDSILSKYRLCFLLEDDNGAVLAGFEKNFPNELEPNGKIISVGEFYDELLLESIDLDRSIATLSCNGETIDFTLSKPNDALVNGT